MNQELKPCPFCGGEASSGKNPYGNYRVICRDCLAVSVVMSKENGVINAWNRRIDNPINQCDMGEIKAAAMPLVELMRRKYNPHSKTIVTLDRIEVLSGEMGIPVEIED